MWSSKQKHVEAEINSEYNKYKPKVVAHQMWQDIQAAINNVQICFWRIERRNFKAVSEKSDENIQQCVIYLFIYSFGKTGFKPGRRKQ